MESNTTNKGQAKMRITQAEKRATFSTVMNRGASKFKADSDAGVYLLPQERGAKWPHFDQTQVIKKGDKVEGLTGTGYGKMTVQEVCKESNGVIKFTDGKRFYRQQDFTII